MNKKFIENMTLSDTNGDVFADLYDKGSFKIVCATISSILLVLTSAAAFGIIWFERFGSDLKRMFTNKMVSSICWSILAWYCNI